MADTEIAKSRATYASFITITKVSLVLIALTVAFIVIIIS